MLSCYRASISLALWEKALLAASAALSLVASVATIAVAVSPVAFFSGYPVHGYIAVPGYNISVYGQRVRVDPLESVSAIALVVLIGSTLPIALSSYALPKLARALVPRLDLELIPASTAITALNVGLLYSVLRVIIADVIPGLPLGGAIVTEAGRLTLYPSSVEFSAVYDVYLFLRSWIVPVTLAYVALTLASLLTIVRRAQYREGTCC